MKDYYLFTTPRGNRYCFNMDSGALLLCHPLLYEMISVHRRGESVKDWYTGTTDKPLPIPSHEAPQQSELDHNYRKFRFLQNSGYFTEHDRSKATAVRLTPEIVATALRNADTIKLELTEACNLRCNYCCYGECYETSSHRSGRHLDLEVATKVLEYLFSLWTTPGNDVPHEIVIAFYGGEPLLRVPAIKQVMRSVRQLNRSDRKLRFKMTTNGMLLDEHADFLADNDIELLISLDGDHKSHSYRVLPDGTESHTRVLDNALMLKRRHPDYFQRQVGFNAVFNNRSSVDRLFEFFKSNFDKVPIVAPLSFVDADPDHREHLQRMHGDLHRSVEQSQHRPEIERAMFTRLPPTSYTSRFLIRTYPLQFQDPTDLMRATPNTRWLPTGTCIPFSRSLFVTVAGEILPCERIGDAMVLGRAGPAGIEIDCESIAQRYNARYDQLTQLCRECHHRSCPMCMLQLDITGNEVQCPEFATEDTFIEYLTELFSYMEEERWVVSRAFNDLVVI